MNRFAFILVALLAVPLAGCSSLAHKGIDTEGNKTVGAGVTADRNGLRLNGVTSYHSTTPALERERRLIAEAKARKAEAKLALAKLRADAHE